MMRILLFALILIAVLSTRKDLQFSEDGKGEHREQLFWIFLTTGKSTADVPQETIQRMQAEHLENFKRLADDGKLLSAGPLADPEKKLRGIVILKAKDQASIAGMFEADPYIVSGYLKIEASPMKIVYGTINTKITPNGLDEFRIVVLEKSEMENKTGNAANLDSEFLQRIEMVEDLLLSVMLQNHDYGRTAVLIMNKTDDNAINEKIGALPGIKSGKLRSRVMPLRLGKGTLTNS